MWLWYVEISGVLDDARRKSVASSEDIALCKALCVSSVDHDVTGERATWMSEYNSYGTTRYMACLRLPGEWCHEFCMSATP